MNESKRYRLKKYNTNLAELFRKNKGNKLTYEVELAKLRLAHKLAELREKMGLTQGKLAERMGVSQQLVSRIESGSDNLTIETLIRFFDVFGVCLKIDILKREANHEVIEFNKSDAA